MTRSIAGEPERRKSTALGKVMLEAIREHGSAMRYIRGSHSPKRRWRVGDRFFHQFTGDALINSGYLHSFILEHDGHSFDRFELADPQETAS